MSSHAQNNGNVKNYWLAGKPYIALFWQVQAGETVRITATNYISKFFIEWGDGTLNTPANWTSTYYCEHTYAAAGLYESRYYTNNGTNSMCNGQTALVKAVFPKESDVECTGYMNPMPFFFNCTNLAEVDCFDTRIKSFGYNGSTNTEGCFYGCTSLTEMRLPVSTVKITKGEFYGCTNLATLNFDELVNVTDLEINCFRGAGFEYCDLRGMTSLTSITGGSGGGARSVWDSCPNLKKIWLPATLATVSSYFITYNASLTDVYMYAPVPPDTQGTTQLISWNSAALKIHVPAASLNAYQTALGWSYNAGQYIGDL